MKLGAPIDLTAEDLAAAGGGPSANMPAAAPIVFAAPVDALDDFDVFNAVEDEKEARGYDPEDPGVAAKIWGGVKSIGESLWSATKGAGKVYGQAQHGDYRPGAALATQTGGEVLANYKSLGEGGKRVAEKAVTPLVAALEEPVTQAAIKEVSRKASWDYLREARAVDQFTGEFNQHLETIFPKALAGLGAQPVDREAAQGLTVVADPANFIPAGMAARWTTQAPMRGVVRAASSALKEATLDVARASAERDAANLLLKPGMNAAERGPLFQKAAQAAKAVESAAARKQQATRALTRSTAEARSLVDQMANEAASQPMVTRLAGAAATGTGKLATAAGRALDFVAALPERAADKLAGEGADAATRTAIADAARFGAGVVGIAPKLPAVALKRTGQALETYGRLLGEAESQLPFFKRLARETEGLTSWGASLVDQSGLGQFITPAVRVAAEASRGAPIAALAGYVGSGGDPDAALRSASGGMVFGLAGGAYGQWQRFLNGGVFRQKQLGDINRYRQTLPTDDARMHFDKMPGADRAALATMQLAHPDLKIKHERLGPGRPSFYYAAEDGPVAVINLDGKDGVNAVLAHEIGHHVEKHGIAPVVERVMFGDPLLKQPGLYTVLDKAGNPIVGADGRYQLNDAWQGIKNAYNDRIKATAARIGQALPARDDAAIAREVFAEHTADYLTGGDGRLSRDLKANVWTKALDGLAESHLVAGLPAMRQVLGKLGVPLDTQKRVSGSNLFPGGLPASKPLRDLISNYHRQSVRGRAPALDDEGGGVKYTHAEVVQHPQIVETLFDGSDDIARDRLGKALREKNGAPKFTTPKEQTAQRVELAKDITGWMEQNAPRDGVDPTQTRPTGARLEKTVNDKTGAVTEGWLTPSLPEPLLRQLEASGKYNPTQIRHLRDVSNSIRDGKGQSLLFFYQPAKGAGGKYKSLAGDWRTETPYALFVSKAGNVLIRTVSREKLAANAQNLVKSGRAAAWNNSVGPLMADVDTYLANHAAGRPGFTGIGEEKAKVINYLFGIDTQTNRAANPYVQTSPKAPVVIRSRRIDRTNRLSPVEQYFPTTYDRLNRNLRPEAVAP